MLIVESYSEILEKEGVRSKFFLCSETHCVTEGKKRLVNILFEGVLTIEKIEENFYGYVKEGYCTILKKETYSCDVVTLEELKVKFKKYSLFV